MTNKISTFLFLITLAVFGAGASNADVIDIDNKSRVLTLIQDDGTMIRYPIAVGRQGLQWTGQHVITRKVKWPSWNPSANMRRKHPGLPGYVPGGPENPLGARALYLGDTLYRIHGTNDPKSIGRAASSGCFRMRNEDVIDLYERVNVGTVVVVR